MSQYKTKVLRRYPDAHPVVKETWPDGTPRLVVIYAKANGVGGVKIRPLSNDNDSTVGYAKAWRNAHGWIVRNPEWSQREPCPTS